MCAFTLYMRIVQTLEFLRNLTQASGLFQFSYNVHAYITIRLGKWSRISQETGLKIGPAFSRALKCEKCRTKKSVKVKHFRLVLSVFTKVYRSEYFVPTLTCLYWFYYLQLAYFIHKMYNIFYILFLSLASLAFLARHLKLVSQSRET